MKYLPIHWKDGMKINQDHFIASDKACRQEIYIHARAFIHANNYGLLSQSNGSKSLDLYLKNDQSQQTILNLVFCKGITRGGMIIDVQAAQQLLDEFRISTLTLTEQLKHNTALYVFININPYQRNAYGEIDLDADDPRKPHTVASCKLTIGGEEEINTHTESDTTRLTIGKIVLKDGIIGLDKNYVPPVINIAASPVLSQKIEDWSRQFDLLSTNGKLTLNQIREVTKAKRNSIEFSGGQEISISAICWDLTKSMLEGIAFLQPLFFQLLKEKPPIETLIAVQQLVGKMRLSYDFLTSSEKNRLSNYFKEILALNDINMVLTKIWDCRYEHENIAQMIASIDQLLSYLMKLYHSSEGLPKKDFNWTKGKIEVENINTIEATIIIEDSLSD